MKASLIAIAVLFMAVQAFGAKVLHQGKGDATFYYDITGVGPCGPVNNIKTPFAENQGYTMCEGRNPSPKRLIQYGTNNIVAMPNGILRNNLKKFCGKRVIVSVNGKERSDLKLVIWDGCQACNGNGGLDFSSTVFAKLFGQNKCGAGRIKGAISYKIVDEQVIPFKG